jgi:hypothetical protein
MRGHFKNRTPSFVTVIVEPFQKHPAREFWKSFLKLFWWFVMGSCFQVARCHVTPARFFAIFNKFSLKSNALVISLSARRAVQRGSGCHHRAISPLSRLRRWRERQGDREIPVLFGIAAAAVKSGRISLGVCRTIDCGVSVACFERAFKKVPDLVLCVRK